LPHKAFALQIRQNLGCYIFTPLSLRTWPLPCCKNLLCPATLKATIVLLDFARSCSTDGGREKKASALTTRAGQCRRECRFSFLCDVKVRMYRTAKKA
jgi:hypothetical protein